MMAVASGPTSCSSRYVPKSELLHNPETQYGFVLKYSLHGGKNNALRAEKNGLLNESLFNVQEFLDEPSGKPITWTSQAEEPSAKSQEMFFSGAVFLPLTMSYVVKQCVMMSWLVRELAHRHKTMTAAQKLEELRHRKRGSFSRLKPL
jgi:hypothetical protein